MPLICVKPEAEYFSKRGWTGFCLTGKSPESANATIASAKMIS
jgi:hypothetical protein